MTSTLSIEDDISIHEPTISSMSRENSMHSFFYESAPEDVDDDDNERSWRDSTKWSIGAVGAGWQKVQKGSGEYSMISQDAGEMTSQEGGESNDSESSYSEDSLLSHPSISSISTDNGGDVIKYQLRGT